MARRRRAPPLPKGPDYSAAGEQINLMERALIYRTVDFSFTAPDVIDVLFPAEHLQVLRAAYPLAKYQQRYIAYDLSIPGVLGPCSFNINWDANGCLAPTVPADVQDVPRREPFMAAMKQVGKINMDMNVLRTTIGRLKDHKITAGCARYYWPGLPALLPLTHPIHQVTGERFRDTVLDPELRDLLRQVGAIQAAALLADPAQHHSKDSTSVVLTIGPDGQNIPFV